MFAQRLALAARTARPSGRVSRWSGKDADPLKHGLRPCQNSKEPCSVSVTSRHRSMKPSSPVRSSRCWSRLEHAVPPRKCFGTLRSQDVEESARELRVRFARAHVPMEVDDPDPLLPPRDAGNPGALARDDLVQLGVVGCTAKALGEVLGQSPCELLIGSGGRERHVDLDLKPGVEHRCGQCLRQVFELDATRRVDDERGLLPSSGRALDRVAVERVSTVLRQELGHRPGRWSIVNHDDEFPTHAQAIPVNEPPDRLNRLSQAVARSPQRREPPCMLARPGAGLRSVLR